MNMVTVAGLALITVILTLLLKKLHPEYAVIAAVTGGAVLLFQIVTSITPVVEQLQNWYGAAGIAGENFLILLKAMGLCFITQFAADTCKDAGESALAAKVELAGKAAVVLVALPLFRTIADTALSLTGGGS